LRGGGAVSVGITRFVGVVLGMTLSVEEERLEEERVDEGG